MQAERYFVRAPRVPHRPGNCTNSRFRCRWEGRPRSEAPFIFDSGFPSIHLSSFHLSPFTPSPFALMGVSGHRSAPVVLWIRISSVVSSVATCRRATLLSEPARRSALDCTTNFMSTSPFHPPPGLLRGTLLVQGRGRRGAGLEAALTSRPPRRGAPRMVALLSAPLHGEPVKPRLALYC